MRMDVPFSKSHRLHRELANLNDGDEFYVSQGNFEPQKLNLHDVTEAALTAQRTARHKLTTFLAKLRRQREGNDAGNDSVWALHWAWLPHVLASAPCAELANAVCAAAGVSRPPPSHRHCCSNKVPCRAVRITSFAASRR